MFYPIILGIHGYGMCIALLMLLASELLLVAARRGHATPARVALHASRCAGTLIPLGVLAGIVLFFAGGWPITAWLIASLILIALLIMVERRFVGPWQVGTRQVLKETVASEDVRALARNTHALLGRVAMLGLFGLVVLLMVVKPQVNF